jgi:hypothetical protein
MGVLHRLHARHHAVRVCQCTVSATCTHAASHRRRCRITCLDAVCTSDSRETLFRLCLEAKNATHKIRAHVHEPRALRHFHLLSHLLARHQEQNPSQVFLRVSKRIEFGFEIRGVSHPEKASIARRECLISASWYFSKFTAFLPCNHRNTRVTPH